jgi:hypothetical protein
MELMNTIPLHNIPGLDRPFAEMHDAVLAQEALQLEKELQQKRIDALCDETALAVVKQILSTLAFLNEETLQRQHTLVAA